MDLMYTKIKSIPVDNEEPVKLESNRKGALLCQKNIETSINKKTVDL